MLTLAGAGDNLVCVHMINAASLVLRTYDVSYDRSPTIAARMLEISRLFFVLHPSPSRANVIYMNK